MHTQTIEALLAQIESLGGKDVADEVRARLAAESPSPEAPLGDIMSLITLASQPRLHHQIQPVQVAPEVAALQVLVEQLRMQKGYVSLGGKLIHRSVIYFVSFLIVACCTIPHALSMLTSAKAGEPMTGLVELAVIGIIGIILIRKVK